MSDLENIEAYADSLYGELEAEKHAHRKDNEYLLRENKRLRNALLKVQWAAPYGSEIYWMAQKALAAVGAAV
jgi:hypothetical protein